MYKNSRRTVEQCRAYEEGIYAGVNLPAKRLKKQPECPYKEDHDLIAEWLDGFHCGLLLRWGGPR
jgi:hypothetical protein